MSDTNEPQDHKLVWLDDVRPQPYDTGRTYFNRENFTIQVWKGARHDDFYEIDLEKLNTPGCIFDMVLQMNKKTWDNKEAVREFLHCLENACDDVFGKCAQAVYCPAGIDHVVDWPTATFKELVKRKKTKRLMTNTKGERFWGWI